MSTRRNAFRSVALLSGSQILGRLLAFGCNIFVARIVEPADYGLAATFWITTGFLGVISDLGFQQQLIQAKDGNDDRVGAVAQSLFLLRGLFLGAVLLAVAGPVARLFGAPEATWAFRLLALVPIMSGLVHRDSERLKRMLNFKPDVLKQVVPEVVAAVAAIPIALATRDYRVFLYLALLKTFLQVCVSHAVAERPFKLGWDRQIVNRFMVFGWPLLVNSVLLYCMMQGDRIVLAQAYTKEELGAYSVAIGLVTTLLGMITSGIDPLVLPFMSRVQADRGAFIQYYALHVQLMGAIALVVGTGLIFLGPVLIELIYGTKFAIAGTVVGWLGMSECIRLFRRPGANAAMALGDTRNVMYANCFRQFGLFFAVLVAWQEMPLPWIALSTIGGEIAALITTLLLLRLRHHLPMHLSVEPIAFAGVYFAGTLAVVKWGYLGRTGWLLLAGYVVAIALATPFYLKFFPPIRHEVGRLRNAIWHRFSLRKATFKVTGNKKNDSSGTVV